MNMDKIMKQAQKMQAQMAKVQEELAGEKVEGSAGGGMVTVTANGQGDVVGVRIDPEVMQGDDVEMLEDLVLAAVNEALGDLHQSAPVDPAKPVLYPGENSLAIRRANLANGIPVDDAVWEKIKAF